MASREGSGSLRGGSSADGRQTPEDAGAGDAVSPQRLSIEMQQAAVGRRSLRDRSSSTKGGSNSGSKSSGSGLAKTVTMKQLGWAKDGDAIDVRVSIRGEDDDPACRMPEGGHTVSFRSAAAAGVVEDGSARDGKRSEKAQAAWTTAYNHVRALSLLSQREREMTASVTNFGTKFGGRAKSLVQDADDKARGEVPTRWMYVNPDGQFRSVWDIFQVFVLFYLAWMTPFRVGFDAPAYGPEFWFETLVDVYFIIDVALNFMTGFWLELETTTVLISDPQQIAVNYLKTWFVIDVLACAPVDLAMRASDGTLGCSFEIGGCDVRTSHNDSQALKLFKLLRIFRLLKLLRLFRVSRLVNRYQDVLIYYHSFISIGRVNLLVIMISHWIGCLFGLTHEWDADINKGRRWLLSVYWAVQSITSVGYGDIPAVNSSGQVLSIFTMLVGVVLVSWIMTNVLAAMNPDSSARRFQDRLQYVLAYLKNNQLPAGVAKRVITFYRWQNMNQFDEKSVLSDLPAQLRKDIFDNLYTDALLDVPIFRTCTSQFMTEVSLRMSPISFPQFHNVYCQGELGGNMYFITKGGVAMLQREVMGQPSEAEFLEMADECVELSRGSFFGEPAVLGYPTRLESIVTSQSSTMMMLRTQDMQELCQLSFEFKAELTIIAMERMRRYRVPREVCEFAIMEFGLEASELIEGVEEIDPEEDDAGLASAPSTMHAGLASAPSIVRSSSAFLRRKTRLVFTQKWKKIVYDRMTSTAVASLPKIFSGLVSMEEQLGNIQERMRALDGKDPAKDSPRAGARGWQRAAGEFSRAETSTEARSVAERLTSLEGKMDALIEMLSKK